jgi:hypothetical protein
MALEDRPLILGECVKMEKKIARNIHEYNKIDLKFWRTEGLLRHWTTA